MKKNNTEQFIKKLSEEIVENSEILVYSDNMKSAKELLSLQKYLIKNPEQRFWQGLINWAQFEHHTSLSQKKNNKTIEKLYWNGVKPL